MTRSHRATAATSALLAAAALCSEAGAVSRVFDKPMEGRYRLDWCLEWASQCGAPAAEAWCRRQGYEAAARFAMDADIGARSPTRVLATGAICAEPFCDGFAYIVCTGRDRTGGAIAPESSALEGTWVNTDRDTRSVTRLEIARSGKRISVHAWGKCRPRDCDWGVREAAVRDASARVVWDQGLVTREMTLRRRGGRLVVSTASRYRDGRASQEWRDVFERAGAEPGGARRPPEETPRGEEAREARALLQRGFGQLKQDKPEQALRSFQEVLALERRIGDRRGEARSLAAVGGAYDAMARTKFTGFPDRSKPVYDRPELVERAIASLREAAALFRKVGDASGEWHALFNIGVIYENRGELDRAVAFYRRALTASDAAGERAKAEGQIACGTDSGNRLLREFRTRQTGCIRMGYGSVSLVFDEDEWWGE